MPVTGAHVCVAWWITVFVFDFSKGWIIVQIISPHSWFTPRPLKGIGSARVDDRCHVPCPHTILFLGIFICCANCLCGLRWLFVNVIGGIDGFWIWQHTAHTGLSLMDAASVCVYTFQTVGTQFVFSRMFSQERDPLLMHFSTPLGFVIPQQILTLMSKRCLRDWRAGSSFPVSVSGSFSRNKSWMILTLLY